MDEFNKWVIKLILTSNTAGVIMGWGLSILTDFLKGRFKRDRNLRLLFSELQFNQGKVSWGYLEFEKFLKLPENLSKEDKETLAKVLVELGIRKQLGWGFKTSAYYKAESEGSLVNLPCYGEVSHIYTIIETLNRYGVPDREDKVSWGFLVQKLRELEKSLKLVINHFYDKKQDWVKAIREEMKKNKR